MSLPELKNWEATRDALHQVALVLGAIRVACIDPMPNDLQFSVDLAADGLTASGLKTGGELRFRFSKPTLVYTHCKQKVFSVSIPGHSQLSLLQETTANFAARGHSLEPSMKHVTSDSPIEINTDLAADFLAVLDATYTALARFRAKLCGYLSPIVLWPHHFDLAFLHFPGSGADERSDPHLAFGFAPFSDGFDRPYLYAYAWSPEAGYLDIPVKSPARTNKEGYIGLYAAYDELRMETDYCATIETVLQSYARKALSAL